jgi:hypothetical protein
VFEFLRDNMFDQEVRLSEVHGDAEVCQLCEQVASFIMSIHMMHELTHSKLMVLVLMRIRKLMIRKPKEPG